MAVTTADGFQIPVGADPKALKETEQGLSAIEVAARELGLTVKQLQDLAKNFGSVNNEVKKVSINIQQMDEQTVTALKNTTVKVEETTGAFRILRDVASFAAQTIVGIVAVKVAPTMAIWAFGIERVTAAFDLAHSATLRFSRVVGRQLTNNLFTVGKAALLVGPALFSLGRMALESEESFNKLLGIITIIAAVITSSLAFAVFHAVDFVGQLAVAIGDKLINAMTSFEKQAAKAERALASFTFVMAGFARVAGEDVVGSLEKWNQISKEVVDNSTFTAQAVQKSIKLLVAEGSKIGLTFEDTSKLLKRSADIAASTGNDVLDVTSAMVKGLIGQSQAAATLGIFLDESSLAHSEFAHETNLAMNEVSDGQKVLLRYAKIFEDSSAVVGAAAADTLTVAGAQDILNRKLDEIAIAFGKQTALTIAYIRVQQELLEVFLSLPDAVINSVGAMTDFLGVSLKIVGTVVQYTVVIGLLSSAFLFLNAVMATNLKVQELVTISMFRVGQVVGAQTVAVTGLAGVWANLVLIMKASITIVLKNLATALKSIVISTGQVLAAVSPLLIKLALYAGAVKLVFDAIMDLVPEMEGMASFFTFLVEPITNATDAIVDFFAENEKGIDVIARIIVVLQSFANLLVSGILGAINAVILGYLQWQKFTATTIQEQAELQLQIAKVRGDFEKLSGTISKSVSDIVDSVSGNALAAVDVAAAKTAEGIGKITKRFNEIGAAKASTNEIVDALRQLQTENMNLELEILNLGATQSEQVKNNLAAAQKSLKMKEKQLQAEGKLSAAVMEQIKLQSQLLNQQANLKIVKITEDATKARISAMESVAGKERQLQIESLTNVNQLIEAQKLQNQAALEAFDKEAAALKEKHDLTEKDIDLINKTREALEKRNEAALVKAGEEQAKKAATPDPTGAIITTSQMAQMGDVLGSTAGNAIGGALASFNPAGAFMAVANMITGAIQGLINFGPQFLDSIAGIFNSLTDLPLKLVESLNGVFDGILNFVTNFVGNLGSMVTGLLDGAANFLMALPDALIGMVESIPDIIIKILDSLPDILVKLVTGLVRLIPLLAQTLIIFLFKGIPRIISGLIKAVPEIIKALVDGFVDGVKMAINDIANALGLGDVFNIDTEAMVKQFEELGEQVSRSASKVFAVADLEAKAKGLGSAENIQAGVAAATKKAAGFLQKLWDGFMKALKGIWMFVWDKILKPLIDAIRQVWLFVWNNVLKPLIDAIRQVWLFVWNKVIQPIVGVIQKAFSFVGELLAPVWEAAKKVLKPIFMIFQLAGEAVGKVLENAFSIFKIVGEAIGKLFKSTFRIFGVIGKAVGKLIRAPIDFLKKTWNTLMKIFTGKISILDGVRELFSNAFDLISDQLGAVAEMFSGVFEIIVDNFKIVWDALGKVGAIIVKNFKVFVNLFKNVGTQVGKALKGVFDVFKKIGEFYKNMFMTVFSVFKKIGEFYKKMFETVFGFVKQVFDAWITQVKKNIETIKMVFSKILEGFKAVFDFFKKAGEAYVNALKNSFEALKNAGKGLGNILSKAWEGLQGAGKKVFEGLQQFWKAYFGAWKKAVAGLQNVGGKLFDGLKQVGSKIGEMWTKFLSPKALINMFKNAFDGLKNIFSKLFGGINLDGLKKTFTTMFNAINPANILSKLFKLGPQPGPGTIEKIVGLNLPFVTFAEGGVVPGNAKVPGNSALNDTVPALLSPGEVVLPREFVKGLKNIAAGSGLKPQPVMTGFPVGVDASTIVNTAKIAIAAAEAQAAVRKLKVDNLVKTGMTPEDAEAAVKMSEATAEMHKTMIKIAEESKRKKKKKKGGLGGFIDSASDSFKKSDLGKLAASAQKGTSVENLGKFIEKMSDPIKEFLGRIIEEFKKGARKMVRTGSKFADGGLIQGFGSNDTVPIMTTPGEFIVNRDATRQNLSNLNFLNRTGSLPQTGTSDPKHTTLNVTINAKTMLSPDMIKREVVPVIEKEFRRSSMRGKFLLSNSGTRDNR